MPSPASIPTAPTAPATSASAMMTNRFAVLTIGIGTVLLAASVLVFDDDILHIGGVGLIVVGAIASSFAAESSPRKKATLPGS